MPLKFKGQHIRLTLRQGEPLWVVKDVCKILGLGNPSEAIRRLDDDDLSSTEVIDSVGRKQQVTIVNEPGLYTLILGSRKPEAREFKRWVTHEVLPSIRKTGAYARPTAPQSTAQLLLMVAQALADQENRIAALEKQTTTPVPALPPASAYGTAALLTPKDAIAALKIGRSTFYDPVRTGALDSVRVGWSIRIPANAISDFIRSKLT